MFVIGLPSFFLALQPNTNPIKGKFMANLAKHTMPSGLCLVLVVVAMYIYQMFVPITTAQLVTMASIGIIVAGFIALYKMCKPFNLFKSVMYIVCAIICISCVAVLFDVFKYVALSFTDILFLVVVCQACLPLHGVLTRLFDWSSTITTPVE